MFAESYLLVYSQNTFAFMSCRQSRRDPLIAGNSRDKWVARWTQAQLNSIRSIMVETKRVMKEMFSSKNRAGSHLEIFSHLKEVLVNLLFLDYADYETLWRRERFKARQGQYKC
jgi:hypothetical protein